MTPEIRFVLFVLAAWCGMWRFLFVCLFFNQDLKCVSGGKCYSMISLKMTCLRLTSCKTLACK